MELEASLSHLQDPVTGICSDPDKLRTRFRIPIALSSVSTLFCHLLLGLVCVLFSSRFLTVILICPVRICPAYVTTLDFIVVIIEGQKLRSFSFAVFVVLLLHRTSEP